MIVASAGHIDHGKTALVKALTGVDTDRLPEEKARGISIDLGFAHWQRGVGTTVGFVDVPGHEQFMRNMLAGVCAIDCVMLAVAADDGVMPQTREHLSIIDLLSIRHGVAVITKADRVSASRLEEVTAEVRDLLASTGLANATILAVSAATGRGIEELRVVLASVAESLHQKTQRGKRLRYAIDRAFTVSGSGTVVTGTVLDGSVRPGDRLRLSPSGLDVRVRGIEIHGRPSLQAAAGERCALNISGAEVASVRRGQWLLHPILHAPVQRMDVRLRLLDSEAGPLRHWTPVHLHIGTADVTARVAMRRGVGIDAGNSALAQLVLDAPVAALHGDRFIVRDQSGRRTLGGGMVLDPWPLRRRTDIAQRLLRLEALAFEDPKDALGALATCSPGGVELTSFGRSFNLDEGTLAALLQETGLVAVGHNQAVALESTAIERHHRAIEATLVRFHTENPQSFGIEIEHLRIKVAAGIGASAFQGLLRPLADQKRVEILGGRVRKPHHVTTDNPVDQRMWQLVQPVIQANGLFGATIAEVAAYTRLKELLLRDFLLRKARTGEVVRVTAERYFLRSTMATFAAIATSTAQASTSGHFTAAEFRDRAGIGRSLSIEILESLDRLAVTQRVGDARVLRQDFAPILGPATVPLVRNAVPLPLNPDRPLPRHPR